MSRHFGFLASTRGTVALAKMRSDIITANTDNPNHIWVAEEIHPHMSESRGVPSLEIVDICLDAIRNSDRLLLVVDGSTGSSLTYAESVLASSYLEMEVFQAAISRIPVHVFTIGEIDRQSPVARLLSLLEEAYPRAAWQACACAADVTSRIEKLRSGAGWAGSAANPEASASALVATFAQTRFTDWANERLGEEIEWLGARYPASGTKPDPALVLSLLDDPEAGPQQTGTQNQLARAWLALRLLMAVPYSGPATEYDVLWNRALSQWASAAAWFGMHAHLDLGHLAALGSLGKVRAKLVEAGRCDVFTGHTASLFGALASCYYSIAGRCDPRDRSARAPYAVFMDRATLYITNAILNEPRKLRAGLHALRGSILLRRGQTSLAIADYEEACRMVENEQGQSPRYGEYLSELGWAECSAGRWREGIRHQEQGVGLMAGRHGPGFETRARSKLSFSLARGLRPLGAFRELVIAHHLAKTYQLHDQVRRGMREASAINALLNRVGLGVRLPDRGNPPDGAS